MSAKPFHQGHFMLIELGATACDEVYIYVSLSDRQRRGEVPILGKTMDMIWKQYLEGIMPHNVIVEYVHVPVKAVYEHLGEAEAESSTSRFMIFGDPVDVNANFPQHRVEKVCPTLARARRVITTGVDRQSTVDVSGTRMREFLAAGDARSFMKMLPDPLSQEARREIWNLLSADIMQ